MAYRLAAHPQAVQEILAAARWYERQQPGLGKSFARWVYSSIGRIRRDPYIYPSVGEQLRRRIPDRFPYQVIYQVRDDTILIVGVFHEHSDPATTLERLSTRVGPPLR